MKVTQITFIAKNPKCLSIKPKRYLIDSIDTKGALEAAEKLLSKDKYADRYKALPALIVEVHNA